MKEIIKGLFVAFTLYSIIPLPSVSWEKSNMKYVFYFFPLVGLVIGLAIVFWFKLALLFSINAILFASVAVFIPILISGGIHFDGFIDTMDAISSHTDIVKKHEILKDPHVGAFGVIYAIIYIMLSFGLYSEFFMRSGSLHLLSFVFILSRALGTFVSFYLTSAKSSGLLYMFTNVGEKRSVLIISVIYILIVLSATAFYVGCSVALFLLVLITISILMFKHLSIKGFGGVSGDLVGCYIQSMELLLIAVATFGGKSWF